MVKRLMRAHREKLLYLVVGAWNTLFQYAVFSLLYWLLNAHLASSVIVLISYLFGSLNGFLGFKLIVFRSRQHPLREYVKFQLVYGPLLALNMVVLPLALKYSTLNAYVVQALFAVFAVVVGYLGNKHFAFRQPPPRADEADGLRGAGPD
jgi:putative flippase GtrA